MKATQQLQASSETAGLEVASNTVSLFERLAKDPTVSVEKLQGLMDLQERAMARDAKAQFTTAMAEAQAEMRPVAVDSNNPQTKSKYASYEALDRALRPIYTKHGFALSFNTGETADPLTVRVICDVSHVGGHSKEYHVDMPADGKGAKGGDVMTRTHAVGSAMSYGQRYLLKLIFNVATADADDDGNRAGAPTVTLEQVATLECLIDDVGADKAAFLRYLKLKTLEELPAKSYATAVELLNAKRKRQ